ncbi:MAG: hypothetical protein NT138_07065 [Planctomycetales bacterium]|nr:hypothetical protein [Planctomycetales bacterium]
MLTELNGKGGCVCEPARKGELRCPLIVRPTSEDVVTGELFGILRVLNARWWLPDLLNHALGSERFHRQVFRDLRIELWQKQRTYPRQHLEWTEGQTEVDCVITWEIASETPIPRPESTEHVRVFFPKFFEESFRRKKLETFFSLMSPAIGMDEIRSNPSRFVMLFRPSMMDSDFGGRLPELSRCLYSRWSGYLEQTEWQTTKMKLQEVSGDLIEAHTSGHIYHDDIIEFVKQINAKTVIPIHTFEPEKFAGVMSGVRLLADGETLNLS